MPARTRPIEKFAQASTKCSPQVRIVVQIFPVQDPLTFRQATAYGKCILADYQAVSKDMCATEFMKLKDCYLVTFNSLFSALIRSNVGVESFEEPKVERGLVA